MSEKPRRQDHLASSIGQRSTIKDPRTRAFATTGLQAAQLINRHIEGYFGTQLAIQVLDFGAGSGRISLQLAHLNPSLTIHATDVDEEAIQYLSAVAPDNVIATVANYFGPLDYADAHFDCIFSISVWSHLPEKLGLDWLKEMQRLCKPGGLLLISTAGFQILPYLRKTTAQFKNVTDDFLRREKLIYKEYINLRSSPVYYPGISGKGSWGNTLIHPDYIRDRWAELFTIVDIREGAMPSDQDLVLMTRK